MARRDISFDEAENAWEREGIEHIPILDLEGYLEGRAGELDRLTAELRHAQENIGFFYIVNHGVPQSLINQTYAEVARFHALPLERKLEVRIDKDQIGYLPMGGTVLSSDLSRGTKPDESEALWFRRERDHELSPETRRQFEGPNKWPRDLPGFRETIVKYMRRMEALGWSLLPIYAAALDLPLDYFNDKFDEADTASRLGHYPPAPANVSNQFGLAPHTDAGFMTLLPQAEVPGLEILTRSGKWLPAPVVPGAIIVNGGDSLVRFTNGRFLSTPHRVITGQPKDRYSIPLFYNPNFDAMLTPVETCVGPDRPPRFEPLTYHEYIVEYIKKNYPHQKSGAA